jgi:hypothetical protein
MNLYAINNSLPQIAAQVMPLNAPIDHCRIDVHQERSPILIIFEAYSRTLLGKFTFCSMP